MYIYDTYMYIHIHMQELCLFANIYVWWRPLEGLEASPLHHPKELPPVGVGQAMVRPRIHTSYLSFQLHRHSVRLKYFTPKTRYL